MKISNLSGLLLLTAATAAVAASQLGSPATGDQNQNAAQLQNQNDYGQQGQQNQAKTTDTPNEVVANEVNVNGTVQEISSAQRTLKIQTNDGNTMKLRTGPDMAWLKQIKKGDKVDVRYLEPVALSLSP